MSSGPIEPGDLLDLKLLPSWLKESATPPSYEHFEGDEGREMGQRPRPGGRDRAPGRRPAGRDRDARGTRDRDQAPRRDGKNARPGGGRGRDERRVSSPRPDDRQLREAQEKAIQELSGRVTLRFVPHQPVLENVVAQVKSNPVAYSVFALARLFLEKPERYDVQLTAKPEAPLYQLGENGGVSTGRESLEANAFRLAQSDFYKTEVVQGEPMKGNFTAVARCRASGTLLGPTNHHAYQPKLRALYEQRFSRRMSFPEYQRQIEIVSDPAVVEQWKEEARSVTTYTALQGEPPAVFQNASETERDFRQHHLPGLIHSVTEQTIDGVSSRQLPDRLLRRLIEDAWSRETRSPSQIMQELTARLRDAGLHIFRHRRGMLFVTSVRPRPFAHEQAGASAQVQAVLQTVAAHPGTNRKDLADKILVDVPPGELETRRMALASDLRWLISEGNVLEFNDGSLDLPRVKVKPVEVRPSQVPVSDRESVPPEVPKATEGDGSGDEKTPKSPEEVSAPPASVVLSETHSGSLPDATPLAVGEQPIE